ncbi:hypothetical protein L2E82_43220 [Cichorium intybus]|uniref:Uncharacterized protein n=1 Tax=Cichorium intybus TaxID=13427 RepID=A0ACB8ZP85_CICIN|nr:hypothetical protein L2E82_43220 [Cichorium intybus]
MSVIAAKFSSITRNRSKTPACLASLDPWRRSQGLKSQTVRCQKGGPGCIAAPRSAVAFVVNVEIGNR